MSCGLRWMIESPPAQSWSEKIPKLTHFKSICYQDMEPPLLSVSAAHIFYLFPCHGLLTDSDLLLTLLQSGRLSARRTGRVLRCLTKEERLSLILQIRTSYDASSPLLSVENHDREVVALIQTPSPQRFSATQTHPDIPLPHPFPLSLFCGLRKSKTTMFSVDPTTFYIIAFFLASSAFGHALLHRVTKTPAQYSRPSKESSRSSEKS